MLNKSEILKKLIQEYDVKTTRDVQELLKDLFAETIQEMLEAELDENLGLTDMIFKIKILQIQEMDIGVRKFDLILEKLV